MALADELGYPDMEALLVAVAEHRIAPDQLVERMISAVDSGPPLSGSR
jgi:guanosine-3',5'-bis(diphosphate) 3'-pyrophosphohydrolase